MKTIFKYLFKTNRKKENWEVVRDTFFCQKHIEFLSLYEIGGIQTINEETIKRIVESARINKSHGLIFSEEEEKRIVFYVWQEIEKLKGKP